MRHLLFALLALTLILGTTGCRSRRQPSASDTVLRSSYSDTSADYADYTQYNNADTINPDSLAAQGLETRDMSFGAITGDNLERGILPSVYFAFDRATLESTERAKLQQAADYLRTNSTRRILIEGHCDWRGTAEYNLGLGDRRARSAKDYLMTLGVEESRIATVSKGDLEAATQGTEAQMAQDRRADLLLMKN